MMWLSLLFGVTSAVVGLAASHYARLPSGATIVLTQFLMFAGVSAATARRR
jgi:ABC-type Mn2+/Zn2+ transport system permease subunit